MNTKKTTGLEGIMVGQTAISTVGQAGCDLSYRGYDAIHLAHNATFEEVAYLLIYGVLPTQSELAAFGQDLISGQTLPNPICTILETLPPTSHSMSVLVTACSALGCLEPENATNTQQQIATRLIAFFVSALLYWYQFHQTGARLQTKTNETSISRHFFKLLNESAVAENHWRALEQTFILYAEHELNASTFALRVASSTQTDFYSATTAAIATLKGSLHGGANEAVIQWIRQFETPKMAADAIKTKLARKQRIMGFGHRVYKKGDPRSPVVKDLARALARKQDDSKLYEIANRIEVIMLQEKGLYPNLDFYTALVYDYLGIPSIFFTPLFAVARMSGWAAHIIEQRACNTLIRPSAHYIGPLNQTWQSVVERSDAI